MLKAAIVYLQGSGGNLLARTLALDPQTVPYVMPDQALDQHILELSADERLDLYNNWDLSNWAAIEKLDLQYRHGNASFNDLEMTSFWTIATYHPIEFEKNQSAELWTKTNPWQNIIFIDWQTESLDAIITVANAKRPDLSHKEQILKELTCYEKLKSQYRENSISIDWEDMLQLETYLSAVKLLAEKLNLVLDYDMVSKLYKNWKISTDKCLN
jgi:hypothetical protein